MRVQARSQHDCGERLGVMCGLALLTHRGRNTSEHILFILRPHRVR